MRKQIVLLFLVVTMTTGCFGGKKAIVEADGVGSQSTYRQAPTNTNQIRLVGYWPMDRNSISNGLLKPGKLGFDGRPVNASIKNEGVANESLYFNGSSSYVDFGDKLNDVFAGAGKSFSISMWINPAENKRRTTLLTKNGDTSCTSGRNQRQFGVSLRNNKPRLYFQSPNGGESASVESKYKIGINAWTHLAVSYDGSINSNAHDRVRIYLNGRQVETVQTYSRGRFPFHIQNGSAHLSLGIRVDSQGAPCKRKGNYTFNGFMDEVAIWSGVFSPQMVSALNSKGKRNLALVESGSVKPMQNSTLTCCNLTGEYTYSGKGRVKINHSGENVHMFLTWTPRGQGPHYEVKGRLNGDTIVGKWYSHYNRSGWYDFRGIVSPSGKIIDFSQSSDPIGTNLNKIRLINNTLITESGIDFINTSTVDGYMENQEAQLRSKLNGSGIDVVRVNKYIVLKLPNNITFDTDSDILKPRFEPVLRSITNVLKEYNSTLVTTIGHTDNVGAIEHNQTLSEKRARSLSTYLAKNGINKNRLTSIGKGEFQPVATNDTSTGRAQNRRVEIMLEPLHN